MEITPDGVAPSARVTGSDGGASRVTVSVATLPRSRFCPPGATLATAGTIATSALPVSVPEVVRRVTAPMVAPLTWNIAWLVPFLTVTLDGTTADGPVTARLTCVSAATAAGSVSWAVAVPPWATTIDAGANTIVPAGASTAADRKSTRLNS